MGIRERELRMKILGYNTWLHKYIAFIIAGGFAGLAGVLWAHTDGIVSPENVVLDDVGRRAADGGPRRRRHADRRRDRRGDHVRPARIPQHLVPWWQYVLGGVYVMTILYLPTGLMGIPQRIRQRRTLMGRREDMKKIAPVTS